MTLHRLSCEEARSLRAPREMDAFGGLALSLLGCWRKEAIFMFMTAYLDESGMGEEEYLTMGGFVGKLGRLNEFSRRWQRELDREKIPYAHLMQMEKKKPPFDNWEEADIARFYRKAFPIAEKHTVLGFTVALHKERFKTHYKGRFDSKTQGDSMFGLCARASIQFLVGYLDKFSGINDPKLTVIFDHNDQFGGAAKSIFYETKRLYDDGKRVLGDFAFGDVEECHGLQAADYLVSRARRVEAFAEERGIRKPVDGPFPKAGVRPKAPVLHIPIEEGAFDLFLDEQAKLPALRARAKWAEGLLAKAVIERSAHSE